MTTADPDVDTAAQLAEALTAANLVHWRDTATAQEFAAALLPVVDRIARTRAAHELDAARQEQLVEVDRLHYTKGSHRGGHQCAADMLADRAAALRAEP